MASSPISPVPAPQSPPPGSTAASAAPISPIPSDTRDRILQAAAEIYEASGRDRFPTVDQVRRTVRADMHAVTTVMREWRRSQLAAHSPAAVQVPERIASTHGQALASLWQQAQGLANEGLRAAQAGWEAERAELEALRTEIVQAFEAQGAELKDVQARLEASEAALQALRQQSVADLAEAHRRAENAETTAHSVGQALEAQGAELKEAHARTAALEGEMRKARLQATADIADAGRREQQAKNNLLASASALDEYRKAAEAREKAANTGRAQLQKDAMQAREKAAELLGRLQVLQEQNAALLARLGPGEPPTRKGR